jgi:hypothetical protein
MRELGGSVKVFDPTPATEKIMRLAGMERIIKIVHSATREQSTPSRAVASAAVSSTAASTNKTNNKSIKEVNGK